MKVAPISLLLAGLLVAEPDPDGHAEIDGSFEFECADAVRAAFIDVELFGAFARMQRIVVQTITPKGQFRATLRHLQRRIALR